MKNHPNGLKLTIVLLVLAINPDASVRATSTQITDADRSEIIRQTLETELGGQKINNKDDLVTDFELMSRAKGGIVLSVKNIKRNLVPQIPRIKLLLLKPREIREKANREGDFLYLVFSQFNVKDSKVVVTLDKVWARPRASNVTDMSGGSETYEFRKVNGRWVRKFQKGYIV